MQFFLSLFLLVSCAHATNQDFNAAPSKTCDEALSLESLDGLPALARASKKNALPGAIFRVRTVIHNGTPNGGTRDVLWFFPDEVVGHSGVTLESQVEIPPGEYFKISESTTRLGGRANMVSVIHINSEEKGKIFWGEFRLSTDLVVAAPQPESVAAPVTAEPLVVAPVATALEQAQSTSAGRYFVPISATELREKILKAWTKSANYAGLEATAETAIPYHRLSSQVIKDLSKVYFTGERSSTEEAARITGYHTLSNGFAYLGVVVESREEAPFFYVIYWDGKKLRAYIPSAGNTWNTDRRSALAASERRPLDEESILSDILRRIASR